MSIKHSASSGCELVIVGMDAPNLVLIGQAEAVHLIHPIHLTFCLFIYLFIVFLGPHLWHMEVPKLGVQSEL